MFKIKFKEHLVRFLGTLTSPFSEPKTLKTHSQCLWVILQRNVHVNRGIYHSNVNLSIYIFTQTWMDTEYRQKYKSVKYFSTYSLSHMHVNMSKRWLIVKPNTNRKYTKIALLKTHSLAQQQQQQYTETTTVIKLESWW